MLTQAAALRTRASSRTRSVPHGATVALLAFALAGLRMHTLVSDTFYDLVSGRYVAAHGIPRVNDLTAAAAGSRWVDEQWLAHLVMYEAWRVGGYAAVVLLMASAIGAAVWLFHSLLVRAGLSLERAWLFSLVAAVLQGSLLVARAQVLAVPLFVAVLALVMRVGQERHLRPLLLALLILCVWANVHGTVVLGALLVAAVAALHAVRERSPLGALAAAAALATPFAIPYSPGATVWYYRAVSGNPVLHSFITEWAAPTLDFGWGLFFFVPLAIVLAAAGFAAGRGYRPPWPAVAALVVTAAVAIQAIRFESWFAWTATLFVALVVQRFAPPLARPHARLSIAVVAASVLLATLVAGSVAASAQARFEGPGSVGLTAAVRSASARPGKVLGDELISNFLIWRVPALSGRVALDSRFEEYPTADELAWFEWVSGASPHWMRAARGYSVLVGSALHPGLVQRLERLHGWKTVYRGPAGVVLTRTH